MGQQKAILEVKDLRKHFISSKKFLGGAPKTVKAVDGVSFQIADGETLGVVGESGCGKSTLGRTILRLHEPDAGSVLYDGKSLLDYDKNTMREMRRRMQIIFQDPYSSLNPRMTVAELIGSALDVFGTGSALRRSHL